MDYRPCAVCGGAGTELHHIVRRSHCKAMVHAEINLIALCPKHHRHNIHGVHGKNKELDNRLKLELQNKLEMLFDKEYLTEDDINRGKEVEDTVKEGSFLDQIPQDSAKRYKVEHRSESHSVVSDSLRPHEPYSPWNPQAIILE